jgi:hypothetical protein
MFRALTIGFGDRLKTRRGGINKDKNTPKKIIIYCIKILVRWAMSSWTRPSQNKVKIFPIRHIICEWK